MRPIREWLYPEMKYLPRWVDRQAAMWAFQPRIFKNARFWIVFAIGVPVAAACPWLIAHFARNLPAAASLGGPILYGAVAGALQGLLFGVLFNYLFRKPARRFLREHLNERGFNLCLECGYDLRGQTTPRCPECGTAFSESRLAPPPGVPDGESGP